MYIGIQKKGQTLYSRIIEKAVKILFGFFVKYSRTIWDDFWIELVTLT